MPDSLTYEDHREILKRAQKVAALDLKPCETPASPCLKCLEAMTVHRLSRAYSELSHEVAELRQLRDEAADHMYTKQDISRVRDMAIAARSKEPVNG